MPYIDVSVEVDLTDFGDQELIDELESRGWWVSPETGWKPEEELTDWEKDWICEMAVGVELEDLVAKEIYEKLRKK